MLCIKNLFVTRLLDSMDFPIEEQITTRDPSDFQEIQSNLRDIISTLLDFYFHTSPDILITPRIFCLIFKALFRFSFPYPFCTHLHAPLMVGFFHMGCMDKKWNNPIHK